MLKHVLNTLKFVVAGALIFFLLRSGRLDFRELPRAFTQPFWLGLAVFIQFLTVLVCGWRWQLLLRGMNIREKFWDIVQFTWIGMFFNNFMLGSIGGDLVKVIYVVRHYPEKKAVMGLTVLIDRFVGLYSLILVAALGFFWMPPALLEVSALKLLRLGVFIVALAPVPVLLLLGWPAVQKRLPQKGTLGEMAAALLSYRNAKYVCLQALAVSFLGHMGLIVSIYALCRSLSEGEVLVPFTTMAALVPVGVMTLVLPVAPAGLGVGQAAFAQLFHWAGVASDTLGANTMTLYQISMMFVNLMGVVSFLRYRKTGESIARKA